jgi:hypothetical protein
VKRLFIVLVFAGLLLPAWAQADLTPYGYERVNRGESLFWWGSPVSVIADIESGKIPANVVSNPAFLRCLFYQDVKLDQIVERDRVVGDGGLLYVVLTEAYRDGFGAQFTALLGALKGNSFDYVYSTWLAGLDVGSEYRLTWQLKRVSDDSFGSINGWQVVGYTGGRLEFNPMRLLTASSAIPENLTLYGYERVEGFSLLFRSNPNRIIGDIVSGKIPAGVADRLGFRGNFFVWRFIVDEVFVVELPTDRYHVGIKAREVVGLEPTSNVVEFPLVFNITSDRLEAFRSLLRVGAIYSSHYHVYPVSTLGDNFGDPSRFNRGGYIAVLKVAEGAPVFGLANR